MFPAGKRANNRNGKATIKNSVVGEIINKAVTIKTLDGRRRCEKLERWAALVNKASIRCTQARGRKEENKKREVYAEERERCWLGTVGSY